MTNTQVLAPNPQATIASIASVYAAALGIRGDDTIVATLLLREAYGALDRWSNAELSRHGLTVARFSVLARLDAGPPEGMRPHHIALVTGTRGPTVTGIVDGLVRDGFVIRERVRRLYYVKLTTAGRRLIRRIFPGYVEALTSILSSVAVDDVDALARGARAIIAAIPAASQEDS